MASIGLRPSDETSANTVRVRKAAYVGKPVGEVRRALREKGLETQVENEVNPGDEHGVVFDAHHRPG